MGSSLKVRLTDALRKYLNERARDKDVYTTSREYIRDLIRQDMQDHAVATSIFEVLDDVRKGYRPHVTSPRFVGAITEAIVSD